MNHRLSLSHIEEAVSCIDPVFLNSPQFVSETLSNELGAQIIVKIETMNPVRSFKGRGAEYFVSKLTQGERLLTASAGNFGQAVAYACRKRDIKLDIYASINANSLKVERMQALGANVILYGQDFDEAKSEAKRVAQERGIRMVEDSFDVETGEGAGTIGIELSRLPEKFGCILIPLGNGALIAGVGLWLKHSRPETKVIAVQARGAPAMVESWRSGKLITHQTISTIADGIGVRTPIKESLGDVQGIVDDAMLVSDESLIEGIRLAHRHLGLVLEPSGAAGLAAILENKPRFKHQTVTVILTGGNVPPSQLVNWLQP